MQAFVCTGPPPVDALMRQDDLDLVVHRPTAIVCVCAWAGWDDLQVVAVGCEATGCPTAKQRERGLGLGRWASLCAGLW